MEWWRRSLLLQIRLLLLQLLLLLLLQNGLLLIVQRPGCERRLRKSFGIIIIGIIRERDVGERMR
jgi:hypothetical protein